MRLDSDDFELFGLPRQFKQDRGQVDARWRALQTEVHPDRFASEGAAAQRVAMQWSVRVNEAYQRLKQPLQRAAYLCELQGYPVEAHSNTAMPAEFLMQQMSWREALDEARSTAELTALETQVRNQHADCLAQLQTSLDEQRDVPRAVATVRALMFIERFADDVQKRLDPLAH